MNTVGDTKSGGREQATFLISQRELANGCSVLSVEGDLDLASAPNLKWALADAQTAAPNVILDFGGVTFIDSTALGVLVGAQRGLDVGARMALACTEPSVVRIFELTGLDGMFDIFPTVDAAVDFLREGAAATRR